jgi:septal ring factor EnvC (AmiA/AmiB activator)
LAGLARIDAAVGENVLAGEPVGVMSATGPAAPTLYLELRRKGQPVNPTPWLASRQNRKNG